MEFKVEKVDKYYHGLTDVPICLSLNIIVLHYLLSAADFLALGEELSLNPDIM